MLVNRRSAKCAWTCVLLLLLLVARQAAPWSPFPYDTTWALVRATYSYITPLTTNKITN